MVYSFTETISSSRKFRSIIDLLFRSDIEEFSKASANETDPCAKLFLLVFILPKISDLKLFFVKVIPWESKILIKTLSSKLPPVIVSLGFKVIIS